jgi:flagella basal body P-ring formation protein FlgA
MIVLALFLAACLPIASETERITAGDLAKVESAFAALPADTPVGLAPAPGVPRVFGLGELSRLARRSGLDFAPAEPICVERPTTMLDPTRMQEAMRDALGWTEARIEIVDYSRYPVPGGVIEFARAALPEPAATQRERPVLWRGAVRYGRNRRFAIWARVRVRARMDRVIAVESLPAGRAIRAEQVRLDSGEGFPMHEDPIKAVEQAIGRVPRRVLPAGATLYAALLDAAYDIARGDLVRVEVTSGEARLELEGRAEAAGRRGEIISVRNPANGKRFRARVVEAGKVTAGVTP